MVEIPCGESCFPITTHEPHSFSISAKGEAAIRILFVNCCLRPAHVSRTYGLCNAFIEEYVRRNPEHRIVTTVLKDENLSPLSCERVRERDALIAGAQWDSELFRHAREFAGADKILIGAPYWDLSFPALLKIYFENIFVCGIAFRYGDTGPIGLCAAKKLLYVTTSGGYIGNGDFGSEYLRGVCSMFGIPDFRAFRAEGLDIRELVSNDILSEAMGSVRELARQW